MLDVLQRLQRQFGPNRALVTEEALTAYECDAFTIHRHRPLAVVLPESTAEVQAVVRMLGESGVPFIPRGAGTCLSGGATPIGPAVIIEMARMREVLEIDTEDLLAVVQPGVVNSALSRHTKGMGLHYAPDPSSQLVCTIGGNLAENAGGPHCFKYGMTTDHILGAVVVLPDGEIARIGGPAAPRHGQQLDLVGLFAGSEGTFGIATEITVRLCPNPAAVRTLLAAFADMDQACDTVSDIVSAGIIPAALEILDQATIRAVEASVYRAGYPQDAAAVLLVELDGPELAVDDDATAIRTIFQAREALSVDEATDATERARLWKGRKGAFGAMGRLDTDLYVLDGVVPRTKLREALHRITAIGERYQLTLTNVFHAGDGNLHPNIAFDGRDTEVTARVLEAGREILQTCIDLGGSISGEHGIGCEKLDHVGMMFDADDLEVMERVRRAFNPADLCNPGKVLPQRRGCGEAAKWPLLVDRVLTAPEDPQS